MKVGVQLDDEDFARALVRGLAVESRNICFLMGRADETGLEADLILSENASGLKKEICLVETLEEERIYDGPPYRIYRYRDAGAFVGNLVHIYYLETGKNPVLCGDIRCRTLCFTSLSGGSEATALAILTGQILYKHYGARCLYLNLCPLDGSKRFLPDCDSKGLLTLLYYLDQKKDFPLDPFIETGSSVDHIRTSLSNSYFDELGLEQLKRLLQKIDDLGTYTFLLLDLGNHLTRNHKVLLGQSEEAILVSGSKDLQPASFFSRVKGLLEDLVPEGRLRVVSLDLSKSEEENACELLENGLLDLSAMKGVQWEAGPLAKKLMEKTDA